MFISRCYECLKNFCGYGLPLLLFSIVKGKVRLSMKLKDEQGEMMAAIDVFAAAIYYLKQDALDILKSKKTGLSNEDIRWVLTVPAIWEDAAKQFMTEAAKKVY